jgi:hypothetical protein
MTFDPLTQIPPKGETIDRAVIMADHPQYTQGIDLWMFLRHSHELTGGFAPYVKDFTSIAAPTLFSHTFLVPRMRRRTPQTSTGALPMLRPRASCATASPQRAACFSSRVRDARIRPR